MQFRGSQAWKYSKRADRTTEYPEEIQNRTNLLCDKKKQNIM